MGAHDLLHELAAAGLTIEAEGAQLVIRPASRLTDSMRTALRAAKPELLTLLTRPEPASLTACEPAGGPAMASPAKRAASAPGAPARRCTGCRNLTRVRTCSDPVAAGLGSTFGVVWPPAGHGADCPAWSAAPAPAEETQTDAPADRPAMSDAELDAFAVRRGYLMTKRGFGEDDADRLAERLLQRDRSGDDRRMCLECSNLGFTGSCLAAASGRARWASRMHDPVQTVLQRCEWFGLRKELR